MENMEHIIRPKKNRKINVRCITRCTLCNSIILTSVHDDAILEQMFSIFVGNFILTSCIALNNIELLDCTD